MTLDTGLSQTACYREDFGCEKSGGRQSKKPVLCEMEGSPPPASFSLTRILTLTRTDRICTALGSSRAQ